MKICSHVQIILHPAAGTAHPSWSRQNFSNVMYFYCNSSLSHHYYPLAPLVHVLSVASTISMLLTHSRSRFINSTLRPYATPFSSCLELSRRPETHERGNNVYMSSRILKSSYQDSLSPLLSQSPLASHISRFPSFFHHRWPTVSDALAKYTLGFTSPDSSSRPRRPVLGGTLQNLLPHTCVSDSWPHNARIRRY